MPRVDRQRRHAELQVNERAAWAEGLARLGGVDEVGAGPWAGPVYAACVVLDPARVDTLVGVDDSKKLSEARRVALAPQIQAAALGFAVTEATVEEIDRLDIRRATLLAMTRAVHAVEAQLGGIDALLVDARTIPDVRAPQRAIIGGDAASLSIAAASILAKVARDALMVRLAEAHPGYGFERHKGYGTAEHQAALARLGPCPAHRTSFAPVRAHLR